MKQPCYIGLEEARQVLAEMGVQFTPQQMQRAADKDAQGGASCRSSSIRSRAQLKIEKDSLVSIYMQRQVEAERNLRPNLSFVKTCKRARFYCIIL